ncbi:hypothetical protein GALL_479050 [mine drainage metagenome]|uniref:Uncharacterized protein n=1 Tax=mine drainage metagenome TaxID=410659 RepID=A0A1J5PYY1_9ZZZZ
MQDAKQVVLSAHRDAAAILAQWGVERSKVARGGGVRVPKTLKDRGAAIMNPAGFWARALEGSDSRPREIELGLKMAAAKLKAGDMAFVLESGLGQVAWLSALALELRGDADELPVDSAGRARLLALAMRAQGAAAKLMVSLGAMATMGPGGTVIFEDD